MRQNTFLEDRLRGLGGGGGGMNVGQVGPGSSWPESSRPGSSRPGPILSLVGMCLIKK